MRSKYSIKDLERLSGIKAHTIRIWEQRHNIIEPKRTETNIRFYEDADLKRLLNVSFLVHEGVKISKVANLTEDQMHAMVQDHARYDGNHTTEINALKMAMFEYNQDAFNKAFKQCVQRYGEQETFTQILGAFISQLGILWQTNTVNVTHEHFVSNLIKQKLYTAIDNIEVKPKKDAPTYLLYLPANELHEIGLLFLEYTLRQKGLNIIQMGQNTPSDYLMAVYSKYQFDYAISVFTTNPHSSEVELYLNDLLGKMKDTKVKFCFCGAQLVDLIDMEYQDEKVKLFKTVSELSKSLCV
jgi:DNA-binding transcriptional MerR regulator